MFILTLSYQRRLLKSSFTTWARLRLVTVYPGSRLPPSKEANPLAYTGNGFAYSGTMRLMPLPLRMQRTESLSNFSDRKDRLRQSFQYQGQWDALVSVVGRTVGCLLMTAGPEFTQPDNLKRPPVSQTYREVRSHWLYTEKQATDLAVDMPADGSRRKTPGYQKYNLARNSQRWSPSPSHEGPRGSSSILDPRTSFWNFDALFLPQHRNRDAHESFLKSRSPKHLPKV
ncbi:MAG: hypothetical protein J3Q66DRAFT_402516 [Benniella sp.]|nr:MAG: hypothetical protein J3Q66DRAFT_402516 [Benniella sp.]